MDMQKKLYFCAIVFLSIIAMDSFVYIHLNINLVYVTLFTLLGVLTLCLHVPGNSELGGYRKARLTLGGAFLFMAVYCVARFFMPSHHEDFLNFWLLTTVSLIFVWLNYTSFLFLIDSSYNIRRAFAVDSVIPVGVMFALGLGGLFLPEYQATVEYALGAVFLGKCVRMCYVCECEWRKVNREQQNYYDAGADILWMRILVWMTLVLSLFTIAALYFPGMHRVYDYVAPIVFIYMTVKVINYLPKKIDDMRVRGVAETANTAQPAGREPKRRDIAGKIDAGIGRWVANKSFCSPELSIKDVAVQIGTNHSYLSQYLNNTLGVTFQIWLNTLRIEESKRILTTENITIEEVGARVGIPQSYNFSRWFRVVTGTTPFRYRKEMSRNAR